MGRPKKKTIDEQIADKNNELAMVKRVIDNNKAAAERLQAEIDALTAKKMAEIVGDLTTDELKAAVEAYKKTKSK